MAAVASKPKAEMQAITRCDVEIVMPVLLKYAANFRPQGTP
jgi:hypothetical protein